MTACGVLISVTALATLASAANAAASFSGNNGDIAYTTGSGIRIVHPETRTDRRLTTGETPEFSADGRRLVFESQGDLFVRLIPRGERRRVARTDRREGSPAFFPTGRRIVFTRRGRLYTSGIKKFADRRRLTRPVDAIDEAPVVSPDGRLVVFGRRSTTDSGRGDADVFRINRDGSGLVNLTNGFPEIIDLPDLPITGVGSEQRFENPCCPDISPDGNQIVFLGPGDDGGDLFLSRIDGADRRPIEDSPVASRGAGEGGPSTPVFTPNGRRITSTFSAFDGLRPSFVPRIFDADGSNERGFLTSVDDWGPGR